MHFFRQFKDHNSGKEIENYKHDPIFWSTFSVQHACNIHFWIWKYLNSFSISLFLSILVCKIPQFFAKSYWFGQLIILFQKVDTLRLLKMTFFNKELSKAIMTRTKLRNIFLQNRSEGNRIRYSKQINFCVFLLRKTKKRHYENLNEKFLQTISYFGKQ